MAMSWLQIILIVLLIVIVIAIAAVYAFVKAFFKYGGEFKRGKEGFLLVYFPWFLYSVFSVLSGFLNIILNDVIPYRYGVKTTIWTDAAHTPDLIKSVGDARIKEIKTRIIEHYPEEYSEVNLVQLFDTLQPVRAEELIGKCFKNRVVDVKELVADNWYIYIAKTLSKFGVNIHRRFVSKFEGDSLLINVLDLVLFPLPIFGNIKIQDLNFRGKVSATMLYDHQPWADHIRILDDGSVSGKKVYLVFSTMRDSGNGFYTITYRPEIEVRAPWQNPYAVTKKSKAAVAAQAPEPVAVIEEAPAQVVVVEEPAPAAIEEAPAPVEEEPARVEEEAPAAEEPVAVAE